jgi:protein SMG6
MDPSPVSGPSRPRRVENNLADRIIQLQRKNAANPSQLSTNAGPSRLSASRSREPLPLPVPSPISQTRTSPRLPMSDEFSRDLPALPSSRQLYNPGQPASAPAIPVPPQDDRSRRIRPVESAKGPVRRDQPVKKLFNPDIHDPLHFHPRPSPVPPPHPPEGSSSRGLQRNAGIPNGHGHPRMTEEEADRERERRRRREGSERGSNVPSKKKESDTRSKGSRSSEGSESLRDRERGKGKRSVQCSSLIWS